MVGASIGFEDEAPFDDHVNTANAGDLDLRLHRDAEQVETKAEKRLESALGIAAREIDQPSRIAGKCSPDALARRRRQQPQVPRGLERDEEELGPVTGERVHKGVFERCDSEQETPRSVVRHAVASGMSVRAISLPEPHVHMLVLNVQHPHTVQAQCAGAGHSSAVRSRGDHILVSVAGREDAGPNADDRPLMNSGTHAFAAPAVRREFGSPRDAVVGGEDGSELRHPIIVRLGCGRRLIDSGTCGRYGIYACCAEGVSRDSWRPRFAGPQDKWRERVPQTGLNRSVSPARREISRHPCRGGTGDEGCRRTGPLPDPTTRLER